MNARFAALASIGFSRFMGNAQASGHHRRVGAGRGEWAQGQGE
ncbi:hypothetical protein S101468_02653 [Acetobacter pasteurianus subsp. pasteurianus]|uniref:Uncharacterized protein n=1 Tax=Acetobacter pasteurianus subsp. pasteurianus TaxID=481145 RepID=A0AAC9SQC1_ACEPA|nr:hypothetical protein S101468_02653 [Acetobacter pasteurianus subsp. pasteurianus]